MLFKPMFNNYHCCCKRRTFFHRLYCVLNSILSIIDDIILVITFNYVHIRFGLYLSFELSPFEKFFGYANEPCFFCGKDSLCSEGECEIEE